MCYDSNFSKCFGIEFRKSRSGKYRVFSVSKSICYKTMHKGYKALNSEEATDKELDKSQEEKEV